MANILDLTTEGKLRQLAQPAQIRDGHELAGKGEVLFGAFRPDYIEARVVFLGGSTRHTAFEVGADGRLAWRCTCMRPSEKFCKHLVATALAAQKEGRGDIFKAAGVLIRDRKVLYERSLGKPAFIAPGGRIEAGETPRQALVRELKEELSVIVAETDLEPFGIFSAEAANHPGQKVHMEAFVVKQWQGEIKLGHEVEELRWLDSNLPGDIELGSIMAHHIVPQLKAQGLIS